MVHWRWDTTGRSTAWHIGIEREGGAVVWLGLRLSEEAQKGSKMGDTVARPQVRQQRPDVCIECDDRSAEGRGKKALSRGRNPDGFLFSPSVSPKKGNPPILVYSRSRSAVWM